MNIHFLFPPQGPPLKGPGGAPTILKGPLGGAPLWGRGCPLRGPGGGAKGPFRVVDGGPEDWGERKGGGSPVGPCGLAFLPKGCSRLLILPYRANYLLFAGHIKLCSSKHFYYINRVEL